MFRSCIPKNSCCWNLIFDVCALKPFELPNMGLFFFLPDWKYPRKSDIWDRALNDWAVNSDCLNNFFINRKRWKTRPSIKYSLKHHMFSNFTLFPLFALSPRPSPPLATACTPDASLKAGLCLCGLSAQSDILDKNDWPHFRNTQPKQWITAELISDQIPRRKSNTALDRSLLQN